MNPLFSEHEDRKRELEDASIDRARDVDRYRAALIKARVALRWFYNEADYVSPSECQKAFSKAGGALMAIKEVLE